jgi:hypothetical protein
MLVRATLLAFLMSGLAHAGEPAGAAHPQPPVSVGRVQYVQASSLNVREQPSATAPILFELRINEQVVVVGPAASPDNAWCQVQARQRTGFLTCALVGDVPLTIDALTAVAGDVDAPGEQRTLAWQRLLALLEVELISAGTPVPPALADRADAIRNAYRVWFSEAQISEGTDSRTYFSMATPPRTSRLRWTTRTSAVSKTRER